MSTTDDPFEQFERETPEFKLELHEGRLLVGNSLAGSRYCLHDLVTGWGTKAALAFGTPELWRIALQRAFAEFMPPAVETPLATWQAWAETVTYTPHLAPAGPRTTGPHYFTRERMQGAAYNAFGIGGFGRTLGHDFVMRLGENGFTPDGFLIGRQATERLFDRYLNGPADVVWEILLPGHERYDREIKYQAYEAGRVPEYWIVDPEAHTVDFFRLCGNRYQLFGADADGKYRLPSVPGLVVLPARLWEPNEAGDAGVPNEAGDAGVFVVEKALPGKWFSESQKGIGWDDVPFVPRPQLNPTPVLFEEFASWCPRAKFECLDGTRTKIDGSRGSRNVLGMLLRTFGLIDAVKVLHPREWIKGLLKLEQSRRKDAERKAQWWDLARKAAELLRAKRHVKRVGVIGSLNNIEPLNFWSELSLVVWDLPGGTFENYDLLKKLDPKYRIDLIDPKHATGTEQRLIAECLVEI